MKMWIYRPGAPREEREVDLPANPGYAALRAIVVPILDGQPLEHVSVLFEGRHADMFVDECGHVRAEPAPYNAEATAIYRANWLKHNPKSDPDDLPWIAGTAVIFEQRVWS